MSDPIIPPPALVLGCNTPHGINVLMDWIEERTGHAPDFHDGRGFDEGSSSRSNGDGFGSPYGWINGDGEGDGHAYGYGDLGDGFGNGEGYGDYAWMLKSGNGKGKGYLDCNGGYGDVDGGGNGSGNG